MLNLFHKTASVLTCWKHFKLNCHLYEVQYLEVQFLKLPQLPVSKDLSKKFE